MRHVRCEMYSIANIIFSCLVPCRTLSSVWTLKTEEKPRFAVDTKAWMTESAKAFVKHIDTTFNGTVFRVGNAAAIGAHASISPMVRK